MDEIIAVVDKRIDLKRYEPMKTIERAGAENPAGGGAVEQLRAAGEADEARREWADHGQCAGVAGLAVTYVGCLGYPALHPVFADFAKRAKVFSIAEPGHTDALEFEDGKLMLGKHQSLGDINWENMIGAGGQRTAGGAI